MTKTKEVMNTDKFVYLSLVFHDRKCLIRLLEALEEVKYERMYMTIAKGVWHIRITYPLIEEA